ncbi:outer membrane protein assembly factor BamB [Actinoplanes lutulentus]|uniref:Outer membrane protein assembly factor BamB n=1 Tax=Actinoplanes lutulentus TaxID=1287878 RepID=A0A327ZD40_9ACTN|nr:PQQ-binding-like beta-propeller repeat protein [Actinoplanes lutulentus]MBB2942389.1 outer membrane protein assembly factor BamB [Actinoplanes lutulentus]RAK33159.1 outer membrane protein assembly factor BamB [Actinoplanes lutulentus]
MTLIDLDRAAESDQADSRRPPPWRYRHAGLLLAAVLMITLGGAAPTASVFWRYLGEIGQVNTAEVPVQLTGDHLYTLASSGVRRELTAYQLDPPRQLWTSEVPLGAGYDATQGLFGSVTVRRSGDVVLVSEGVTTTALDAGIGAVRWSAPFVVTLLSSGHVGVVVERIFRPGTEYDQASGDPGPLYFSATGVPHTEAPIRTEVRGIDLTTGKTVWTTAPGGSVTVDPARGGPDPAAVLITASDRLIRLDGATGRTLAETELPELNGSGPFSGSVIGDVAMVGYQDPARLVAYDARTLRRLWQRDRPDVEGEVPSCRDVICSGPRSELLVLNPATGDEAWAVYAETDLASRAGSVLETRADTDTPIRLADPLTGKTLADLGGWDQALEGEADGVLVVRRDDSFAAVLPGHHELTFLGTVDTAGADCSADEHHVVCRDGTGLGVWAYRI